MLDQPSTEETIKKAAIKKAHSGTLRLLILSFFAGAMIAFAAAASTIASMNLTATSTTLGLGKLITGMVFTSGLIMVVLSGSELFTGNSLMINSLITKKISFLGLLRNWFIVYLGNFLGAMFIALSIWGSGLFNLGGGTFGTSAANIANAKIALDFFPALILGVLCNVLVCLAVWLAFSATTVQGKILAIFFPIMLFVLSGFEHSIANMYYIPAGLLAQGHFDWLAFFHNLAPVTLGNIIGGVSLGILFHFAIKDAKIKNSLCLKSQPKKSKTKKSAPKKR